MEVACLSSVKLHLCYEALIGTSHVSSDSQVSIELLAAIVLEVAPHFLHLAHTPVQLNAPAASNVSIVCLQICTSNLSTRLLHTVIDVMPPMFW